jgi:hypothetical protein
VGVINTGVFVTNEIWKGKKRPFWAAGRLAVERYFL